MGPVGYQHEDWCNAASCDCDAEARYLSGHLDKMTEYAELLRFFFCNPSLPAAAEQVHKFEHEHWDQLKPLWGRWQAQAEERERKSERK